MALGKLQSPTRATLPEVWPLIPSRSRFSAADSAPTLSQPLELPSSAQNYEYLLLWLRLKHPYNPTNVMRRASVHFSTRTHRWRQVASVYMRVMWSSVYVQSNKQALPSRASSFARRKPAGSSGLALTAHAVACAFYAP